MKVTIITWHRSEKETIGLAKVGLKHGDILEDPAWVSRILDIYNTGLNVMLAHTGSNPDNIIVGVSDDLFKTR
jgi:hypothetical protein